MVIVDVAAISEPREAFCLTIADTALIWSSMVFGESDPLGELLAAVVDRSDIVEGTAMRIPHR